MQIGGYIMDRETIKELGEPLIFDCMDVWFVYENKGFVCLNIDGKKSKLKYSYVNKNHRGEGIFSKLMDKAINYCKESGVKEINSISTLMALDIYINKYGFKITKSFVNYFKIKKEL